MTEHTEDVEARCGWCGSESDDPGWTLTPVGPPRPLCPACTDLLAARDARLLAEVERDRDRAEQQATNWSEDCLVMERRAEAAEADLARLRRDIEALADDLLGYNPGHGDFLPAGRRLRDLLAAERDPEAPVVLDLDDRIFDGQTLPDALADYEHVHSTTGVCVKNTRGPFCAKAGDPSW